MKIDGKQIADKILADLKERVGELRGKNITPSVAIIIVGNDPASSAYVQQKSKRAGEIGINTIVERLNKNISQEELLKKVQGFNNDENVHGIIVQQPLPSHINTEIVTQAVNLQKDVDGFLPSSPFEVPIANAVLESLNEIFTRLILDEGSTLTQWLRSKEIVVMGKGETGGRPTIDILRKMNIQPQIVDTKTANPKDITKAADIIISAVGKPGVLKPEMIKKEVVLIGIGISRSESASLVGDYREEEIKDIASFYTPTPGGIGPINIAMLLKNVVTAADKLCT